jgi:hypothetical protein
MKRYNRDNCQSVVRATIQDQYGRIITLMGKHAFEWSIVIESCGKVIVTSYNNSKAAKKVFNQIKRR